MNLHRSVIAGAAMALALAPVAAQAEQSASPAGKLSLSRAVSADQVKRAGTPVARNSRLTNGAGAGLVFVVFAAGVATLFLIGGDNKAHSP